MLPIQSVFFLSYYDGDDNAEPKWLFGTDLMDSIRATTMNFGLSIPFYDNTELSGMLFVNERHPPITGHRLLVSLAAFGLGTAKAILCMNADRPTAPKAVEWVYAAIVSVMYVEVTLLYR